MPRSGIYCAQLRATQQAKAVAGRSSGCPHPCLLALNRSHAVGVGWGCTIPSGASLELGHRPRTQPAPICRQESKGAAFVPRVGCSNRPGGRRATAGFERSKNRSRQRRARRRASASAGLRVFYWLVRGIFVSRRELSNKVTWGFWGRKMEFSGRRARGSKPPIPPDLTRTPCLMGKSNNEF